MLTPPQWPTQTCSQSSDRCSPGERHIGHLAHDLLLAIVLKLAMALGTRERFTTIIYTPSNLGDVNHVTTCTRMIEDRVTVTNETEQLSTEERVT